VRLSRPHKYRSPYTVKFIELSRPDKKFPSTLSEVHVKSKINSSVHCYEKNIYKKGTSLEYKDLPMRNEDNKNKLLKIVPLYLRNILRQDQNKFFDLLYTIYSQFS
jgi:hypothetical protein